MQSHVRPRQQIISFTSGKQRTFFKKLLGIWRFQGKTDIFKNNSHTDSFSPSLVPGANGWCPGTSNLMAGCSKIKDYLCWFTSNNMSEEELNIAICIKGWDGAIVLSRSWEIFATRYPCIQFRLIFEENLWHLSKRGANLWFLGGYKSFVAG